MFNTPFNYIKTELQTAFPDLKLITWYNAQFDSKTIHTVPAILIEFPDELNPETLNRQLQQIPLVIRIYLVHKIHSDKDGDINSSLMQQHELFANNIYDYIQEYAVEGENGTELNSFDRIAYKLDMSYPGFAVTYQDFECLYYQQPASSKYHKIAKPDPKIIPDNAREKFIKILTPNGGETWTIGEKYQITWEEQILGSDVKIELLPAKGQPTTITEGARNGSFEWLVPDIVEGEYRIRITSNDYPEIKGISDNAFNIDNGQPSEFITVTSPNGGESWTVGEMRVITWNRNLLVDRVKITLLDRNLPVLTITESVTGTMFSWNIPIGLSYSRDYKVEIQSNTNPGISDQSDNAFEILVPKGGK